MFEKERHHIKYIHKDNFVLSNYSLEEIEELKEDPEDYITLSISSKYKGIMTYTIYYQNRIWEYQNLVECIQQIGNLGFMI